MIPTPAGSDSTSLGFREKPLIQTLSEAFWHFEELVVAEQLNNIPQAVVDGSAVTAAREVAFYLESQLRCEISKQEVAFQVEHFDAVSAAGDQPALEFLSSSKGFSSFSLLTR
ncbi:MAG TPA: hypothetical protein VEH30_17865 [Terriglobales bacterium]|nr:hypothetical protein [Terriglobales bacterium]